MVKKFTSKQLKIAKTCYASSKAVPHFGSLMISFAVHVIDQAEKQSILKIHQKRQYGYSDPKKTNAYVLCLKKGLAVK